MVLFYVVDTNTFVSLFRISLNKNKKMKSMNIHSQFIQNTRQLDTFSLNGNRDVMSCKKKKCCEKYIKKGKTCKKCPRLDFN